jgi:AbrB family looped-hinge helix DNA binding protein
MEDLMEAIKISPKFQVVIPKAIRNELHLIPGQTMQAMTYGNRIELIPEQDLGEMRGFLTGMNTTIDRENDRL